MGNQKELKITIDDSLYKEIAIAAIKHDKTTDQEIECAIANHVINVLRNEYMDANNVENCDERDALRHIKYLNDLNRKYGSFT